MDLEATLRGVLELARLTRTRVSSLVTRAVIDSVNDALKTQRVNLVVLEQPLPNVEHFQPYGVSFTPPAGAEAIALAVGGDRSHTVALCAQHPGDRPTGNDDPRTGGLYTAGEWRLFIDAGGVVHAGAKAADDFVALAQKVLDELNDIRTKFDGHTHPVSVTGSATAQTGTAAAPTAMGPASSVAGTTLKAS